MDLSYSCNSHHINTYTTQTLLVCWLIEITLLSSIHCCYSNGNTTCVFGAFSYAIKCSNNLSAFSKGDIYLRSRSMWSTLQGFVVVRRSCDAWNRGLGHVRVDKLKSNSSCSSGFWVRVTKWAIASTNGDKKGKKI